MKAFLTGGLLGAALAYFLDPNAGSRRRNVSMDKLGKYARKTSDAASSQVGNLSSKAGGLAPHQPDNPNPDDITLNDRIESEIFGNTETGRENINVEVVNGIATLRGEQPTQQAIDDLVQRVRNIPNVRGVVNYLHLPGTPAPNKEQALEVSG